MSIIEIILIGIGLSMDAFAVSICKGLSIKKLTLKKTVTISLYFGIFQAIMPLVGYLLGTTFSTIIIRIDHWVAFILLFLIGFNMIIKTLRKEKNEYNDKLDFKTMILLSIATSIDALAIGITFSFLRTNILLSIIIIGIITFVLTFIGVKIGNKFGFKYEQKSSLLGGAILIIIGIKILLEHLGIIINISTIFN